MKGRVRRDANQVDRRGFLRRAVTVSASVSVAGGVTAVDGPAGAAAAANRVEPGSKGRLPTGRLGALTLSRLIAGGNLLSGWCHQRDLLFVRNLATAYLTERRQFDTLQMLEENGVNAILIDPAQFELFNRYRSERGGRMQPIVSVRQGWGEWGNPGWPGFRDDIRQTIDQGPAALYVHGGYADRLVQSGRPERIELLARAVEHIRGQKIPAGIGAHALEVPRACEARKLVPDFYVKTFHHDRYWSATPREHRKPFCVDGPAELDHNGFHDNIFCLDAEATAGFMLEQTVPWIAFKVLAAGAITPQSGFQFAFENGADFIAVGMFDFEVEEDLRVVKSVLADVKRERPWAS